MANYVTSDTTLTAVANAIRSRTGKSAQIEYADGFVSEINGMIGKDYLDGHLVDAVASAPIASFPDGANGQPMLVTARITPVQDLSGGAPYPPGGGKNKFDTENANFKTGYYLYTNDTEQANAKYKYTQSYIPLKPNTEYAISYTKEMADAVGCYANLYDANKQYLTRITISGITGTGRVSGTFTTTADTVYARFSIPYRSSDGGETDIQLEIGSTATPYSPYSHICPITGWTGAEVNGTGKNLCAGIENGAISQTTGENTSGSTTYRTINHIPVTPNGSISVSGFLTKGNIRLFKYGEQRKYIESVVIGLEDDKTKVITMDANTHFIRFQAGSSLMVTDTPIQAETGSRVTAYEAFGTTMSVNWQTEAGTVYGGSLAINKDGTGEIVSEVVKFVFDGSDDEGWELNGANGFYTEVGNDYKITQTPIANYLKCLENGSSSGLGKWEGRMNPTTSGSGVRFMVKPDLSVYDTVEKWKTYLSNNNLEVILKLATPVTYTLTSQQVGQLLSQKGLNNVWADTGNCAVEYSPDTDLWIQKVLAGESA